MVAGSSPVAPTNIIYDQSLLREGREHAIIPPYFLFSGALLNIEKYVIIISQYATQ